MEKSLKMFQAMIINNSKAKKIKKKYKMKINQINKFKKI
jgi:hypothetical protein